MHWWNEFPDPAKPEIWAYAPRLTFSAGETVDLHVNASRARFNVVVTLEAVARHCIFDGVFDTGRWSETGETCYADGCDWPVLASFRIPDDAPAGAYRIKLALEDNAPVHHLLVFVRSEPLERKDRILLVAATNTYAAYNNWGGASHYGGMGHDRLGPSHRLNARRPWARGIVWLPEGAPRIPDFTPTHESGVRYPHVDWAKSNGVYRYYAASGWAHFERHFVVWAEANGFAVDVVCQSELHEHPQCLNGYKVVACVGHDEYWTWEMRDAIDSFVDAGGNVVRLAGNFMWQTRLNTDNGEQTTYKYSAREHDPVYRSAHPARTTTSWEAREVSRPGALTFGVNATRGMYAGFGGLAARGARGFTVYRPDHWMFEGTWLGYGDLIGNEA
ncbi:hypothetical protein DUP91_25275, partial [Salmonella enterica subsp. enterica]|nr:hypothetical protein [Salmonella enterica subsp. enterica]